MKKSEEETDIALWQCSYCKTVGTSEVCCGQNREPLNDSAHDTAPPDDETQDPCTQDCGNPYCRKCGVVTWSDFRP